MLQQLLEKDEVRLCTRCGALLEDDVPGNLCPTCRKAAAVPPSFWRRDDRIAGWIREHFVEPVGEQEEVDCPSCHASVPPRAIFCPQCGHKLVESPETAAPDSEPVVVAPDKEDAAPEQAPPAPDSTPSDLVEGGLPAAEPSWWQQALDFWRDQFRPRGSVLEQPTGPWYERVWRWLGAMFGSLSEDEDGGIWLWIVLGILLVAVAAMILFWATMLRSGDLVFY